MALTPWWPSPRLWTLAVVMCLVTLVELSRPVAGSLHPLHYTMDVMRFVQDHLVPPRLSDPAVPGAIASDRLACRTKRDQGHKPPKYDNRSDAHFRGLQRIPHSVPTCPPLDFSTPLDGEWVLSEHGAEYILHQRIAGIPGLPPKNGSEAFPLPSCRLRRLSADQALTCLRNKHISFLGDSTTRFQVLTLLHLLSNDGYQDPMDSAPPSPGHVPSVSAENAWGSWPSFYGNMTSLFSENGCINTTCTACDHDAGREYWHADFSLASGARTRVSLITELGHGEAGSVDLLRRVLNTSSADRPDVLVFNHGIWFLMGSNFAHERYSATHFLHYYEQMFQQARMFVAAQEPPRTRLVYRATTVMAGQPDTADGLRHTADDYKDWWVGFPMVEKLVKNLADMYKIDYYDVEKPARQSAVQGLWRMDGFHYHSFVNDMANDVLMNILC